MSEKLKDMAFAPTRERPSIGGGIIEINHKACSGCGLCNLICPASILQMKGKGKGRKVVFREGIDSCMSCGCCEAICEQNAITLAFGYDHGGEWVAMDKGELSKPRIF